MFRDFCKAVRNNHILQISIFFAILCLGLFIGIFIFEDFNYDTWEKIIPVLVWAFAVICFPAWIISIIAHYADALDYMEQDSSISFDTAWKMTKNYYYDEEI